MEKKHAVIEFTQVTCLRKNNIFYSKRKDKE